tara:strand:+ start:1540 stop:2445 length:906 start_codon:yes stop_codon:yes gene_type:complete
MSSGTATAPGKIVLSGEYAVLGNAPAIAMAVNRRAVASIVTTPQPSATDTQLLASVCQELGIERSELNVLQDTDAFYSAQDRSGRKLGIGSSAALTVALCRLLAPAEIEEGALLQVAHAAHRRFQGDAGSGVDIATSVTGGLLCYRREPVWRRSLAWPSGLHYKVLWSGVAASTVAKIDKLQRQEHKDSVARLASVAETMADCWMSGNGAAVLSAHVEYLAALRQFDSDHQLGVFAAGHDALCIAAETLGLAYKPCGAGGGDIGIALSNDTDILDQFVAQARAAGFLPLDLQLDPQGVSDA